MPLVGDSPYAMGDPSVTIEEVPANPAYIRVLTAERLQAARPSVELNSSPNKQHFSVAPLLKSVASQTPILPTETASESTTCDLDDGRVILRHAMRSFGWCESTQLSFTVEGNGVSVYAVNQGGSTLESKQGRCLIPLAIRRRLSLRSDSTVLVVTEQLPAPHVRIYSSAYVYQLLRKEEHTK